MEKFKKIVHDGMDIEVGDFGSLRRLKPSGEYFYYKQTESTGGYLTSFGKGVHQWVAIAWLNHTPCGQKTVVHHIDSNPKNNKLSNLKVVTSSENHLAKEIDKTSMYDYVSFNKQSGRFFVMMKTDGKQRYYGSFSNEDHAGLIVDTLKLIYNKTK